MSIATITRCDLSATILLKLVDSYLVAFKFAHNVASIQKNWGDKSHRVIVAYFKHVSCQFFYLDYYFKEYFVTCPHGGY